jgi:predicted nicotinamide N-methyase
MVECTTYCSGDDEVLDHIQSNLESRKKLALYRIDLLQDEENGKGFPSVFVPILCQSVEGLFYFLNQQDDNAVSPISDALEVNALSRILSMYLRIARLDPTLDEELGMEGSHRALSRLIKIDNSALPCCQEDHIYGEQNQDTIMGIQDLACEIASFSKSFPVVATPLTAQELRARLPLIFHVTPALPISSSGGDGAGAGSSSHNGISILINQVTTRQSAQQDVGFVMWPSAVVLARWLVSNPEFVREKIVLELGAGCGLVGLVAAKLKGAKSTESLSSSVILSDFNSVVVKNLDRNLELNDLKGIGKALSLDFYQQLIERDGWTSTDSETHCPVDVILASDIICQPDDAFAAARTIACALKVGGKAIVVSADSKHRFGVEKFEEACQMVGCLTVCASTNVKDLYDGSLLSSTTEMLEKTSGFVDGMNLTMYQIERHGNP